MTDTYRSVGMYVKPDLDRDQWRQSPFAAIVKISSGDERVSVQKVMRRRTDRRLRVPGLCRALILLLVLALATSGLLHGTSGGHAGGAAMHAHDLASVNNAFSGGEACCDETDGQAHEPVCGTAAGCSLCVPVVSAVLLVRPDADRAEMEPTGRHSGLIQPPQIRPPKL
ncbi:MAG TPA: hypothetical protein VMO81_08670 [Aestuariivirgaceae bacterium]|nr:hypothetical protein [Aestuariivirgaceae bacterium]